MIIEYVDGDESRIKWSHGGEWKSADLVDLIEAYEAEPFNCSLEEFGECSYRETGCSDCKVKEKVRNAIDNANPVKHGRWLPVKVMDDEADFGEVDGAECSVCGYTTNSEYWAKTYDKFCPNCGADMREVTE